MYLFISAYVQVVSQTQVLPKRVAERSGSGGESQTWIPKSLKLCTLLGESEEFSKYTYKPYKADGNQDILSNYEPMCLVPLTLQA